MAKMHSVVTPWRKGFLNSDFKCGDFHTTEIEVISLSSLSGHLFLHSVIFFNLKTSMWSLDFWLELHLCLYLFDMLLSPTSSKYRWLEKKVIVNLTFWSCQIRMMKISTFWSCQIRMMKISSVLSWPWNFSRFWMYMTLLIASLLIKSCFSYKKFEVVMKSELIHFNFDISFNKEQILTQRKWHFA